MMMYTPGDLLLLQFPLTSGVTGELRPGLVRVDVGDQDVIVERVTRQMHGTLFDIVFTDWKVAGLLAPAVVRLHKIATLEKALVSRKLGTLQPADRSAMANVLSQVFWKVVITAATPAITAQTPTLPSAAPSTFAYRASSTPAFPAHKSAQVL